MANVKKRGLALIMALAMMLGMLPVSAMAADWEDHKNDKDDWKTPSLTVKGHSDTEVETGEWYEENKVIYIADLNTPVTVTVNNPRDDGRWGVPPEEGLQITQNGNTRTLTATKPTTVTVNYNWSGVLGSNRQESVTINFQDGGSSTSGSHSITLVPTLNHVTAAYVTFHDAQEAASAEITEITTTTTIDNYVNSTQYGYCVVFVKPEDNYLLTGLGASGNGDLYPVDGPFGNITGYPGIENLAARAKSLGYTACFGWSRPNGTTEDLRATFETVGQQPGIAVAAESNKTTGVVPNDELTFTVTITPGTLQGRDVQVDTVEVTSLTINEINYQINNLTKRPDGSYQGTVTYTATEADCENGSVRLDVTASVTYTYSLGVSGGEKIETTATVTSDASARCTIAEKNQVSYRYTDDQDDFDPVGLPAEPTDNNSYYPGDPVTVEQVTSTEVHDTTNHGTWNFQGWTLDETPVGGPVSATGEAMEFVGLWKFEADPEYTVTFDTNDGIWTETDTAFTDEDNDGNYAIDVVIGETVIEPTDPTKTDPAYGECTLEGWYTTPDFDEGTKWEFDTDTVTEDITLYARWGVEIEQPGKRAVYAVEHYKVDADGTVTLVETEFPLTGVINSTATATAKTYTGYTLDDDYTGSIPSGSIFPTVENSKPVYLVLKLYYTQDTATVTFDTNDGTWTETDTAFTDEDNDENYAIDVVIGETVTEPTDPTKTDPAYGECTLEGWYTTPDFDEGTKWEFDTDTVTEDITLYARWGVEIEQPGKRAVYAVEHYKVDANGTVTLAETEFPLTGVINSTATATAKTYTGYTLDDDYTGSIPSGSIFPPTVENGKPVYLVLKLYYAVDNWNDEDDTTTGGDGIPDKYQVVVNYISAGNGTVSGETTKVFTLKNAADQPTQAGKIIPGTANVVVTPASGYKFNQWDKNPAAELEAEGGKTYTYTASFVANNSSLTVNKSADKTSAKVGEEITYTITIKNTGNMVLNDLTVTDPMMPVNPTKIDTLAVGETETITYKYTVTEANAAAGNIRNTVTVTDGDKTTGGDTTDTTVTSRYTVTTSIDHTRSNTITPTTTYNAGEDAEVYFTVGGDYYIDRVTVDGERYHDYEWDRTVRKYVITFEKIDSDHTVVVETEYDDGYTPPKEDDKTEIEEPDVPLAGLDDVDHFAYIKGYEDGTVRPDDNITREEVATIFYRLLTDVSREMYFTEVNDFSDVDSSNWSNKAISTLANAGIINGYPDGTFQPKENITRAEFAAIAARFDVVTESAENPFTDIDGHWGEELICFAASKGWVNGYPDDTFRPERDITRAEAMTLINRVLDRAVDEEGLLKNAKQWPDNQKDDWFYYAVLEATNSHDYERRTAGEIMENWIALTADRTWDE